MTANTDITQKRRRKRKGRVGDHPTGTGNKRRIRISMSDLPCWQQLSIPAPNRQIALDFTCPHITQGDCVMSVQARLKFSTHLGIAASPASVAGRLSAERDHHVSFQATASRKVRSLGFTPAVPAGLENKVLTI
jgi:hypothetical protein